MAQQQLKTISVRQLKELLEAEVFCFPDAQVTFGTGDLSLDRVKNAEYAEDNKTPVLIQIRFNELYKVTYDPTAS